MSDTRFVSFIFDGSKHSQKSWIEAYSSLQYNPTQASAFLTNREISGTFITGFEVYSIRIAEFLRQVPRYTPKSNLGKQAKEELNSNQVVGGHLIRGVLLPLLENEYRHLHSRDALFELLVSAITLSDRRCFDQLAIRLGEIPHLLGKIISDARSSDFIQEWVGLLATNSKSMQDWTETVVNLAENCDSDHGVVDKVKRWSSLKILRTYLLQAGRHLETSRQSFNSQPGVLSQETITLLEGFGMHIPHSERTLSRTIDEVETTQTLNVMKAVINTFPCRLCFSRGYGNVSNVALREVQTDLEQRLKELDLGSFEGLLGSHLGIWKISLSAQAMKDLIHSKKEGNFLHVKGKLEALASGEWNGKSIAKPVTDVGGRFKVRVFQAWYGSNGRILWQVDVGFDEERNTECQIVRVWRIGDVKEILSSLDSVGRAQQAFSPGRIAGCKKNLIVKNRKIPAVVGSSEQDLIDVSDPRTTDERTPQDMLISGKFHTLTSTVISSVLRDQSRSDFPFDVTGKEVEIIKHFRTATFILGRSGTGKTSCLLYKLLSRYLARNLAEPENPIRQLLLTRSEPLARKLESEVQLLIDTQLLRVKAGFKQDSDDDEINIPTYTRDGIDEETTEDLFSLRNQDFPLVCTFGNFLKRLENTIKAHDRKVFFTHTRMEKGESSVDNKRQMVDFAIFKAAYWQQFPTKLRAGLEPDLVFTEIMGVIKGVASLLTGLEYLSREEYRFKSSKLAPTFASESDRDRVYDVFEHYESKKKQNGDYDGIDRVKVILSEFSGNAGLKARLEALFEEVYVDEVQDQRPLEIELLLNLVQNPRGIHFAGDSAQCISKDSTFRFANVKALFYNHFSGSAFAKIDPRLAKPELFSLSRNFRSHQGILSLASFVMELLWKGFPDMVDKLSPEVGQYLGPKPVIFVGSDLLGLLEMAGKSYSEDAPGENDDTETKQVKNRQIVIVRDQLTQEELQKKLGDGSLVFTILQSKGMEYDDIFLFDFFSSSPCPRSFRSLRELLQPGVSSEYSVNHMAMCSELKNLYVAITRPRSRLWILESSTSFIVELFTTMVPDPLVKLRYFESEDLPGLMPEVRPASATSAREWIETGQQCMEQGIFDQALRCFKNAQSMQNVLWAEASIAEQKGRESRAKGDEPGLISYFKEASGFFLEIGMRERAAHCLEAAGDFGAAAELYSQKGKHEKAAELFEKAGVYEKAANQYHEAGVTYKALRALYNGELFELLVHSVHKYRNNIEDGDRKTYARECNILLRQGKIASDLWSTTFDTFISDKEKEDFLKEFQHKKELLDFYLARGRLKEAFEYSVKLGEFEEALELIINRESEHSADLKESEDDLQLNEVFKYAQTRKLFSSISKPSTTSIDLSSDQSYSGNGWSRDWAGLVTTVNGYFKDGIKPDRGSIKESWMREYMDTIVSMKVGYFLKSGEYLDSLPLEYLCGLAEIVKTLSENKYLPIPRSVLLCLGVLPMPGESNSCIVLTWSSLPLDSKSPRTLGYEEVSKKAIAYISKQVPNTSCLIETKARKLWDTTLKMLKCDACVTRGKWDDPEKKARPGPKCSHDILSETQFLRSMEGLLRLCRSFDTLGEHISLNYWLDALLSQLKYDSSCFQDAGVITAVIQAICTLATNTNIIDKLRNRFSSSWKPHELRSTKQEFTSLLENYQLGCNLGVKQSILDSAVSNRVNYTAPRKGRNQPPADWVYSAIKSYQSLRSQYTESPSRFSAGRFCQNVCGLLQSLLDLRNRTQCLSFYHGSVISTYEDIVTFLLFSSRRTDVLIPRSWTKLYLPHWEPYLKTTTDLEQCCYQQTLLRVVASFCGLVSSLESSPHGKSSEKELLARRSVDLLAVSLINMGTTGPLPLRYDEIWGKVQKVFSHKGLKTDGILGMPANELVKPLSRAFQFYGGKDSLMVYVREGKITKRVESWEGTGIRLVLLPPRQSPVRGFRGREDMERNAAFIIQAWYRRRQAKFIRGQKHMETASGRAISFLQTLCNTYRTEKSPRRVFWEFSAVMFTEGLELYLFLDTISAKSRVFQELTGKIRVPEGCAAEFMDYKQQLHNKVGFLFEMVWPNAFSLETDVFQVKCKEGLETAKSIGDRMNNVLQTLQKPPEPPRKAIGGKDGHQKGPKVDPKGGSKSGPKTKDGLNDKQKGGLNNPPKNTPKGKSKESKDSPKGGQKAGSKNELEDMVKDGLGDGPKNETTGAEGEKKDEEGKEAQGGETGENEMKPEIPPGQLSERQKEKSRELDVEPSGDGPMEEQNEEQQELEEARDDEQKDNEGQSSKVEEGKDASKAGGNPPAQKNKGKKKKSKKGKRRKG